MKQALLSNDLQIIKLVEDVYYLNKSIDEEWHDHPDFQYHYPIFQEKYYKKYYECMNIIDQFNKLETLEDASKVIITMADMRRFLLMKISDILFVKIGKARE